MKKIKTGADRLVEVIQNTNRISLDDATKILGSSKDLIQEWAEFLEKEKLISIDYSFSKVFFTPRKLSSKEIKESAKDIVFEKDAFVRKVEYALASLEKESVNFEEIKNQFNSIHGEVHGEIKVVEHELADLEKYNKLKNNVDKEIEVQKNKYRVEIDNIGKDIKMRESEFVELYAKLTKEKESVVAYKERIAVLQDSQKEVTKFINSANDALFKIKDEVKNEEAQLNKKIASFKKLSEEVDVLSNKVLADKKKKIGEITASFEAESRKLMDYQNKLLMDARTKTAKLENYENMGKKIKNSFEGFFHRTIAINKKIEEIDADKVNLKNNFLRIHAKAKALTLMNSNDNLKKQAEEIAEEIKKQEEAKKQFIGKIKSLLEELKL